MTITDFFAALAVVAFPGFNTLVTFVTLTLALAAPLAFLLAWKDKKEQEQKNQLNQLDGWSDLIAELGLDEDSTVLTWRQRAHQAVDSCFDKAEATAEAAVKAAKAVKAVANRVFGFGKKAVTLVGKGLGYAAVVTALLTFTAITITGAATVMWLSLPFVLTYAATKAAAAKVSEMIAARKAAAIAAAEAAEIARLEAVKAEAISLGFVSREDVEAMIAKHEAMMHAQAAEKAEDSANFEDVMVLVASDEGIQESVTDGVTCIELIDNAVQVVKKSIQDFDLQTKAGRKAARTYLRDNGVAVARHANRYEIAKKFHLLN
jgi:hypothetical protein